MERERKTPAGLAQEQAEKLKLVCLEILSNTKNELYLHLRFMDRALGMLRLSPDFSKKGAGTDGSLFYFHPQALASLYLKGRACVNRLYFHSILHCIFCHMYAGGRREKAYWDLACDIAVEYLIDTAHLKCLRRPLPPMRRQLYQEARERVKVINAQSMYRFIREKAPAEKAFAALAAEFYADDHSLWDEEDNSPRAGVSGKDQWDALRETMETELETFSKQASDEAGELLEQIRIENREKYDYRTFLKKFTVLKETPQLDLDSFDYIYYDYGMQLYGNMPLIEPLETREARQLEEFAIVIDTSMSCSGELVRRFLEQTCAVLSEAASAARRVNIHVIQCDERIQSDRAVTSANDLQDFIEHMEIKGGGGTDFRPAFEYISRLSREKVFTDLKGLIYFTDGYGTFPSRPPAYDTAFVFFKEDYSDAEVPPWAIKLILDPDDLEAAGGAEG